MAAAAAVRWAREEPELHDDRGAVRQLGALRAIGERVDGDDEDDGDVELARVGGGGWTKEGEIKVCERRLGEDELDGVVDELDLEDNLAVKVLARGPDADADHVDGRVEGGEDEKRAVEQQRRWETDSGTCKTVRLTLRTLRERSSARPRGAKRGAGSRPCLC